MSSAYTVDQRRWNAIQKRCLVGGNVQETRPTYIGVENGFIDFSEFVAWSRTQYGHDFHDRSGRLWQLDKDLIMRGNKTYSPDLCLFVPAYVNSFFLVSNARQGNSPIGVSFNKSKRLFVSQSTDGTGKPKHLGSFDCKMEAHTSWKNHKAERCKDIAQEFQSSHPGLYAALIRWVDVLESDKEFTV